VEVSSLIVLLIDQMTIAMKITHIHEVSLQTVISQLNLQQKYIVAKY